MEERICKEIQFDVNAVLAMCSIISKVVSRLRLIVVKIFIFVQFTKMKSNPNRSQMKITFCKQMSIYHLRRRDARPAFPLVTRRAFAIRAKASKQID